MFEERVQDMGQHLQVTYQEPSQQRAATQQETCLTVKAARFNDENNIKSFTTAVTQ